MTRSLRLVTALLAGLLLAVGIAACGGSDSEVSDVVPRTIPDLVAPKDTSLPDVAVTSVPTTNSVTTPTVAPTAETPAAPADDTGGTGADAGGTAPADGGTGSDSGGLTSFCDSNPGAC